MQNEPMSFSSMNFLNASVERDFVKKHLGPALATAGYGKDKLNLMVYDDGSDKNPMVEYVDTCLNDPDAAKYINGMTLTTPFNLFTISDPARNRKFLLISTLH